MHIFMNDFRKKYRFIGLLPIMIIYGCGGSSGNSIPPVATAAVAGSDRSCALFPLGNTIMCWGVVPAGNTSSTSSAGPVGVSGIKNAVAISVSAGTGNTCALIPGGTVQCWGVNSNGQLGNGTTTESMAIPVTVANITSAAAISVGGDYACALITGGTIQCWGADAQGQLGNGATTDSPTPVAVSGITNATAVSAGYDYSCALITGGTIQCWGSNAYGQLGNGATTNSPTPVPVTVSNITNATAVSAGYGHACALIPGGTIQCWGLNTTGQLGNQTLDNSSTPVPVTIITTATAISAGANHTCALLATATAQCWGLNNLGQLGNGTTTNSSIPVPVYFQLTNIAAISVGVDQTCVLLSEGKVECWGLNNFGQLGNGTTTDSAIPVPVNGITGM